jgi:hypothetical protein
MTFLDVIEVPEHDKASSSVKEELSAKTIMCVLYGGITEASRVIQP